MLIQPVVDALDFFSESNGESRGEVFTREEVVAFILDLTGWNVRRELSNCRLLEPSCGAGDFLIPAITRLLESLRSLDASSIGNCIVAVEVNRSAFDKCRRRIIHLLGEYGYTKKESDGLVRQWLFHADFLTLDLKSDFTHVIGNPPYLRQESLPAPLLNLYRSRFQTMYDRADLYVPFFEKGLKLLKEGGRLGYICSDRWMKNRYGGPLRDLVFDSFHLDAYIDFTGRPAFLSEVVAYPAVTIIRRGKGSVTRSSIRPEVCRKSLGKLAKAYLSDAQTPEIIDVLNVVDGSEPWLLENLPKISELRKIEKRLPKIEEAGCKIGIGVATGADRVFIGPARELEVEPERKLPILTTRDVVDGVIEWQDRFVVNPFDGDTPKLVDPDDFPKFKIFLEANREILMKRHVAKKNPHAWFKTIDRIYPELMTTPKLLIPDIKGKPEVVYDKGEFYPHHNFYYVTSDSWNLRALQAVLLSPIARAFVAAYSLKMRGDCLRFQAQYLRRIRLPEWDAIPKGLRQCLVKSAENNDQSAANLCIREIYGLNQKQWAVLSD